MNIYVSHVYCVMSIVKGNNPSLGAVSLWYRVEADF